MPPPAPRWWMSNFLCVGSHSSLLPGCHGRSEFEPRALRRRALTDFAPRPRRPWRNGRPAHDVRSKPARWAFGAEGEAASCLAPSSQCRLLRRVLPQGRSRCARSSSVTISTHSSRWTSSRCRPVRPQRSGLTHGNPLQMYAADIEHRQRQPRGPARCQRAVWLHTH